jgi:hypothetical protein
MSYELRPISDMTEKPAVAELCKLLGAGQIDQRAAQAAAWHLANEMSWQELAAKELVYADGRSEPYFAAHELLLAAQIAQAAESQARREPDKSTPGNEATSK